MCACVLSHFSCIQLFVTPGTLARQAPLSMEFSGQEYWSRLPFPPPGDFPNPGIEPASLLSTAWTGRFFTTSATWEGQCDLDARLIPGLGPSVPHPTPVSSLRSLLPSGLIRKVHLQVAERPAGVQHRSHNGSDGGTNVTKVRKPALELTPCLWHSGAPWSLGIRNVP